MFDFFYNFKGRCTLPLFAGHKCSSILLGYVHMCLSTLPTNIGLQHIPCYGHQKHSPSALMSCITLEFRSLVLFLVFIFWVIFLCVLLKQFKLIMLCACIVHLCILLWYFWAFLYYIFSFFKSTVWPGICCNHYWITNQLTRLMNSQWSVDRELPHQCLKSIALQWFFSRWFVLSDDYRFIFGSLPGPNGAWLFMFSCHAP